MTELTPIHKKPAHVDHYGNEGDKEEHYSRVFHADHPGRIVAVFYGPNHRADSEAFCQHPPEGAKKPPPPPPPPQTLGHSSELLSSLSKLSALASEVQAIANALDDLYWDIHENASRPQGVKSDTMQTG